MASAALEGAITVVRKESEIAVKGMRLGRNLFPGTCQMSTDVLRALFYLLRPDERIAVRLTEDMMMIPFRSTSVVIPAVLSEESLNEVGKSDRAILPS